MAKKKMYLSKMKDSFTIILDKPYIGGEIRSGSLTLELPKRKRFFVRVKKKKKNPNRVHLFTIPMKEGLVEFVYYKDTGKFCTFYSGGVHRDFTTNWNEQMLKAFVTNIIYTYIRKRKIRGQASHRVKELVDGLTLTIKSWQKPFSLRKYALNRKKGNKNVGK